MESKEGRQRDYSRLAAVGRGLVIGLFVGVVISLFRLLIMNGLLLVQWFFGQAHHHVWLLGVWLLISIVLSLLIGVLIKQTPEIKGSGIPQVEGQLMGELDYHWWPVLWKKFVGGVLAIGSGLFLGREGPSIQLGATVGQGVAAVTHNTGSQRRLMIASGASAGLSAAFNAPIASTLFILEEVYHNFSTLIWLSALASALAANFVSTAVFGLTPVLHISYFASLPLKQYGLLIVLGIALGLLGRLYQSVVLRVGDWYHKITWLPDQYYSIIALILLMPVAWYLPSVLGGGNGLIVSLGMHTPTALILLGIFVLRFVYSMIAYGTGLPGGIFLPILTLGAVFGAFFGKLMVLWQLTKPEYVPILIIAAMAGYFAGISKAPFTAILLITEMVGSLHHLMPLAVVSLIAYMTVDLLNGAPVYAAMLEKMQTPAQRHLTDEVGHMEIPVFANSVLDGKQVREVNWPQGALLTEIQRGERRIVPRGDTLIRVGDLLIVHTPLDQHESVRHALLKMNGS